MKYYFFSLQGSRYEFQSVAAGKGIFEKQISFSELKGFVIT
jgi:hypothetical protein